MAEAGLEEKTAKKDNEEKDHQKSKKNSRRSRQENQPETEKKKDQNKKQQKGKTKSMKVKNNSQIWRTRSRSREAPLVEAGVAAAEEAMRTVLLATEANKRRKKR